MIDFDLSSPIQVVLMLLYRFVYFWISPSPRFWNSLGQAVSFFMDACVWVMFIGYMIRNACIKKTNRMGGVFILIIVFFTLVYGIGTHTGGTAMRHRGQLLGMLVMCAVLNKKKESFIENG